MQLVNLHLFNPLDWDLSKMKNIFISGATSAIAFETARLWANKKYNFYLVGRNQKELENVSNDLQVLGAGSVYVKSFDLTNIDSIKKEMKLLAIKMSKIDIALIAQGSLINNSDYSNDSDLIFHSHNINFLSAAIITNEVCNQMFDQKYGKIIVIGSVAGDRGRKSNYIYGSSKGALDIYLEGLRQKYSKFGINILCVKPGFVDTPMTQKFKKNFLWAKPSKIAKDIINANEKNKFVIYTPWFWYFIMLIIKLIPTKVFNRLNL